MKALIPIQAVKKGDRIGGKEVVNVLHRFDVMVRENYTRITLDNGGWPIVDGYDGKMIEVEKEVTA